MRRQAFVEEQKQIKERGFMGVIKKLITRAGMDSPRQSPIKNVETGVDVKLIIQGIEDGQEGVRDGAGWSISIMNPEGTMVMAVAGDAFAVVGLGACAPKP